MRACKPVFAGFTPRGRKFWRRRGDDLLDLIQFQSLPPGLLYRPRSPMGDFVVEIGVAVPDASRLAYPMIEPRFPPDIADCIYRRRLAAQDGVRVFGLDEPTASVASIARAWHDEGLAWLEHVESVDWVLEQYRRTGCAQRFNYVHEVMLVLAMLRTRRRLDEARSVLQGAVDGAHEAGRSDWVEFGRRLGILLETSEQD